MCGWCSTVPHWLRFLILALVLYELSSMTLRLLRFHVLALLLNGCCSMDGALSCFFLLRCILLALVLNGWCSMVGAL